MSKSKVKTKAPMKTEAEVIPPYLAVKAMRDNGYKNTAYALAELIDNSIQADANCVEVLCLEKTVKSGKKNLKRIDEIAVIDNGIGMDSDTLRLALQFGNGTHLEDRSGIGRFGMGLPNSSISQCRRVDVWTWQSGPKNAMHTFLDLDSIESGSTREIPEPTAKPVPENWLTLSKEKGTTGTLVVWKEFDKHRLSWKGSNTILRHTESLIGRMYRKFIDEGTIQIRLAVLDNNGSIISEKLAVPNDPLYLMAPSSTDKPFDKKPMFQQWGESNTSFPLDFNGDTHSVEVRLSWATPETLPDDGTDRGSKKYGKHAAKNIGVSVLRAGRELILDGSWAKGYDPTERWWGAEIEFPPALDEVFGVTNNKQDATVFSHMSKFDWTTEAEEGESFMHFKRRLKEEGDTRHLLIEVVSYLSEQLKQIRNRLKDQTKGRRSGSKRHDDTSVEDRASSKWKNRASKGYKAETDEEEYDKDAEKSLVDDLVGKNYDPDIAREIAEAVQKRNRKVIFVEAEVDSQAFFNVEAKTGGVTEIVFNSRHPAYDSLIQMLDPDLSEDSDSDLIDRIESASNTLKLILAAWARYEEEDLPSKDKIRDIRHEWGKMAKDFLTDED